MKKNNITFFVLLLASICSLGLSIEYTPDWPEQGSKPVLCNRGLLTIATPTATITETAAEDIGDYLSSAHSENLLSAKVTGFEIRAKTNGFIVCDSENIATGTNRVGRLVSEGQTYSWNGLAGTFEGQIIAASTTAVIVFDQVWGW